MAMIDIIEINLGESLADAALLDTANVVFNASFRLYCEKNLCGQYGVSYYCPPDCGTPRRNEAS